ncbi:MAG: ABC transporter substrate-binding protein [Treponema sp.]|jgi:NitT/TauT family transport system substrate-binding protein|nr:ABC transporter substrate-binding protein [Treponema sp.]
MKTFQQIILLSVMGVCAAGILAAQNTGQALTIYGINGPSGVGMIRLFEHPPRINGFQVKVESLAQADLMAARFVSGEAKVGVLPPNVAAKIASTGKAVQVAAVLGNGMLSLLSSDGGVRRIEDLKGKTVAVAGQGATPEFVFRKILLARGLNPERDLKLDYALAIPEISRSLIAGRISLALLPEPFATMALSGNTSLRTVGDIQDEWNKANGAAPGGAYPMTVLVVDAAFAKANPEAVRVILADVKASIDWIKANPAEAGALVEKHNLGLRAPAVRASIPRSNHTFIPAADARPSLEALLRAFLEFAPQSIGGALPKDSFYYKP